MNELPLGYHYTESGLDNVYLANGFALVDGPGGRKRVSIVNIDGLHDAIGAWLINKKETLSGKEIRFLRHEMLLSQRRLAKLLGVSEQAVQRWEKAKTDIPKPAECLIRLLYRQKTDDTTVGKLLELISELENSQSGELMARQKTGQKDWQVEMKDAA